MALRFKIMILLMVTGLYSCGQTISGSASNVNFIAVANQTNTTGASVKSFVHKAITVPQFNGVLMNPSDFWIDIMTVGMSMDNGPWYFVKNGSTGASDIVTPANIVQYASVDPGSYSAFILGYSANWSVHAVFTNKNGTISDFIITNATSQLTNYCLIGLPAQISYATNQNLSLTNAGCLATGSYSVITNGLGKTYTLNFDTIGLIEVLTNSSGTKTNAVLYQPTLTITEQ